MDDEDGRCLLDVICDPQALNDFLHGSEKLHVQEPSGNHLSSEQSQPSASVDLDFLEDDILGSPGGAGGAEQPCDILQQSLQEANITEQTLEAEAELDLGSFQLPALQPVVPAPADGAAQIFPGGAADLLGLQPPAVLTHQALVQPSVGADVVNKAISVQPFLQQVGLGNVTIQPISNLPGLPNGSPGGALGIGPIQVVGQQVMAINPPAQQLIAKPVQPSPVAAVPVGGYIAQPEQQQVTLAAASAGVSPQGAGLVIQKNLPAVATTTLNGSSVFGAQGSQPLTVTSNLGSPLVQAQNVIIHRTPTPIQPKPAGVLQQKLYQITPKPFAPNNATLTIQNDPALQPQKAQQQNLTFMAGKAGQNVVLSGFPQGLPANVFKQPPPQQQALSKPMSVHLLNQGSSIVIPAQHVPQAVLQGQNQFLLPGQLAGASAVPLTQQLSALPANMGGQILATSHAGGQAHIIASQGPGGQLIANQALPAQILTNQNLAGPLNLGPVLTSPNAPGTAHILSAPIQVGQPALFQMPVSLAGGLSTQSQPVATSLGQTVIQGVTLPSQVAMLNAEGLAPAVSIQAPAASSQSPGLAQPQPPAPANLLPGAEQPILAVQAAAQPPAPLQLNVPPPAPGTPQPSPGLASSPEKIIAGAVINQDSMQMFLQQCPAGQQKLGDNPQLPAAPLPQIPSPRPPSQPQPLSRPPSQPQTLSRPPSEPLARSCTPQAPPGLYVLQGQVASSPLGGGAQHPLRPPSQPQPFQPPPAQAEPPPDPPHAPTPHFQLQFPPQTQLKAQTPTHGLHHPGDPPRTFGTQFQPPPGGPGAPAPQKPVLERFQQVPQGIILQPKQQPPSSQAPPALAPPALAPFASPSSSSSASSSSSSSSASGLGGAQGQAQPGTGAAAAPAAGIPAPVPAENKPFSGVSAPISAAKAAAAPGKPGTPLALQQTVQPKPGVISSVLAKGPVQIQVVGKGLAQLVPPVPFDSKPKKTPPLQPSKEACFLEQLHKHQGSVLHPDYKTSFRSLEDALQRLLPYHVYQGVLPSPHDYRKVDEEFEVVSAQLLRRTQAMLNKYRLLLLEESRRVSPSAEMVMIDRMFIQEEKTMLALDKQLAKEKPDEYVSSSSRAQTLPPAPEPPKVPPVPPTPPLHPTKLVIKHGGGGSPSVSWAAAPGGPDGDEDALPSRSKPPIKTYEARSRIGLKLKIKQEAGLSKVVHNTALDPVHQPPRAPPDPPGSAAQMNGTLDHPPEKKPPGGAAAAASCRLPLRKTYRENVDAFAPHHKPAPKPARPPRADEGPRGAAPPAAPPAKTPPRLAPDAEFYRGPVKPEPPDPNLSAELGWDAPPLVPPPAKRRKSESLEVDNASFSSDSPPDAALSEHLQSAIDSILNLQHPRGPSSRSSSSSSPFGASPDALPPPSHNGGLGARTLHR
ncbi:BRD4-interacting chromatin-remodeling complex-associated protein isoform X2 [Caloenas nicobarica]|uniref:BRD4-interacting chromatin-remodeling complex-associated protein isoform X2 n=1 Tax=Caloenas nicobarica TaxID=187106 RepID=UPI0032B79E60